ncbi:mitotic spindle assembly checkpoint protein MAD1 [Capronia epimyces CBS 606.96]|uniref:Spindle assembly checkpoint component MAD1 n=1 Tax=Capronia epimyces CBS 606.96 TaxID=1182542 RepID=W9YWP3_9EURO|nr:mitotic spindle assembly checkpoint protein MAD1 [Capronia epimyces CBS 606.96]EXJ86704.1 mitotic spindle assembly checkpoint protein MAD1 [Capronia epimyces CBS 606.96]
MSSPASKRMRLSTSRSSLSGRKSLQGGPSSLPRPPSAAGHRHTTTQPTYDFLTGGVDDDPAQPLRQSRLRQPSVSRLDHAHDENLRARVNSLEYELKNLQQERGLLALQHDKELRDQQARAEADFKKYQAAESAAQKAIQRQEALSRELREAQDQSINEKTALERKLRDLQDQNSSLKEDAEDAQARLAGQERHYKYQMDDVEAKRAALQETVDNLKRELEEFAHHFESTQARLSQRDNQVEILEAEVAALKSHSSDSETLNVLQTQLSEQVAHIRSLEATNREQLGELRRLREAHRSVQVVQEQKHGLEVELQVLKDVERQLGEAQIQKEILEDEKRTWTTLLESNGNESELKSPEAVVKALIQQRIEYASVMDRLGTVESDLAEKDEIIRSLEGDKASLKAEMDKLKTTQAAQVDAIPDNKAYKRLERQRVLAVKEVEYLRAQLKTFDTEETVLMDNQNFDAQRSEQIKQLEALVDQYKSEVQTLHSDLSKLESAPPTVQPTQDEPRGTKRSAESQEADGEGNSQLGALLRKNKNLQIALQKTAQQSQMLATDLQATKTQLKALRESSKTRILELRDNPTANSEAVKMSTLRTLKQENAELLAQLRGGDLQSVKMVPTSTVDALKLDLKDMEMVVAEKEKRMRRQREIWTQKAAEFRDVIASVLGYKVNFLPNGKAKVSSLYYGHPHGADEDSDEEDEHYIVFDGDNGTMKISGGPESAFGEEIRELVNFWVKEKKQIPCFLAAMTLEFYEKFASSARPDEP